MLLLNQRDAWIAIFLLVAASLWIGIEPPAEGKGRPRPDADELAVHFFALDQANAVLIQTQTEAILVDGGPVAAGASLVKRLRANGVTRLRGVVVTDPRPQASGALERVVSTLPIDTFYDTAPSGHWYHQQILQRARDNGADYTVLPNRTELELGLHTRVRILQLQAETEEPRPSTPVVVVERGNMSLVLLTRFSAEAERQLIRVYPDLTATVLLVSRHGQQGSATTELLSRLNPRFAVLTISRRQDAARPDPAVISRLQAAGITLYQTDCHGDVTVLTDGHYLQVLPQHPEATCRRTSSSH